MYLIIVIWKFERASDPFGVERVAMAMSHLCVHASLSGTAASTRTMVHVLCSPANCTGVCKAHLSLTGIVSGAAGHNRGGVVETPLLARTQGGNTGDARRRCFWS